MTVFTMSKVKGADVASRAKYFENAETDVSGSEDYYLKVGSDTVAARFMGSALDEVGLSGAIQPGDYLAMFSGVNPRTGELYIPENRAKYLERPQAVLGFSTSFNVDKSLSVFFATLSRDEQTAFIDSMMEATDDSLNYLHFKGYVQGRRSNQQGDTIGAKLNALTFAHITNRSAEPHIHTHVEIPNHVYCDDGKWRALNASEIYKRQAEIRAIFDVSLHQRLAENLPSYAHRLQSDFEGYGLQLAGISDKQLRDNSTRRNEIETLHEEMGGGGAAIKARLAKTSRMTKKEVDRDSLDSEWKTNIGEIEDAEGVRTPPTLLQVEAVLFKGGSVVREHHIDRAAAQLAIGDSNGLTSIAEKRQLIIDELGIIAVPDFSQNEEKQDPVFTTTAFVKMEAQLVRYALRQSELDQHRLSVDDASAAIRDFEADKSKAAGQQVTMNPEQAAAVRHIATSGGLAIMEGAAGTGKSFTLGAVQHTYQNAGYQVIGLAPSGKAAEVLSDDGIPAVTMHRFLLDYENKRADINDKTLIILDEAGMADTRTLHAVARIAEQHGAKLVLSGDSKQLESVGSASTFATLASKEVAGSAALVRIARQRDDERTGRTERDLRQISRDWLDGSPGAAFEGMLDQELVHVCGEHYDDKGNIVPLTDERYQTDTQSTPQQKAAQAYLDELDRGADPASLLLLADTRKDVRELNDQVRQARIDAGKVDAAAEQTWLFKFGRERREETLGPGDRVMFRRPDKELGVVNGTTGKVIGAQRDESGTGTLIIELDSEKGEGTTIEVNNKAYQAIELAYATTVHKSQGMTVDRAYYAGSEMSDRRSMYVAYTRGRFGGEFYIHAEAIEKAKENAKGFEAKQTAIGFETGAVDAIKRDEEKHVETYKNQGAVSASEYDVITLIEKGGRRIDETEEAFKRREKAMIDAANKKQKERAADARTDTWSEREASTQQGEIETENSKSQQPTKDLELGE